MGRARRLIAGTTGERVHLALAVGYLFLLPLETTPKDLVWLAMAAWSLLRAPWLVPRFAMVARDPALWLLMAWCAWTALSVLWSADRAPGLDELRAWRVIATPLLLLPALRHGPWLIGAFLAGVFVQNLAQGAQALELFGMSPSQNNRLDGWLHAIQTGAFCATAICWHLAALLNQNQFTGRWRAAAVAGTIVGLAAATFGLVCSGSRGPWLAALVAVPGTLLWNAARRPEARRRAAVVTAVGLLAAAAAWPLAGGFVRHRLDQATAEIRAAAAGDYDSDVGLRLARWQAAWAIFLDHPLAGTGGGGFGAAVEQTTHAGLWPRDHHAHSVYMHELATRGAIGAAIVVALLAVVLRRALARGPAHPYADGTPFVLVGWLIGAAFDCYQLSGNTFGLLTILVALTLPGVTGDPQTPPAGRIMPP